MVRTVVKCELISDDAGGGWPLSEIMTPLRSVKDNTTVNFIILFSFFLSFLFLFFLTLSLSLPYFIWYFLTLLESIKQPNRFTDGSHSTWTRTYPLRFRRLRCCCLLTPLIKRKKNKRMRQVRIAAPIRIPSGMEDDGREWRRRDFWWRNSCCWHCYLFFQLTVGVVMW